MQKDPDYKGPLQKILNSDHNVLNEESESRKSHRYAVLVQDLATQWLKVYPCKTKTSQETMKCFQKFLDSKASPKVIYTDNPPEFVEACDREHPMDGRQRVSQKGQYAEGEGRDISDTSAFHPR